MSWQSLVTVRADDLALVMGVMDTLNAKDYPMHAVKVNLAAARLRAELEQVRPTGGVR
jgi:hypothetical protein